ncbi:MAG: hypothetical protein K8R23_10475 [Chthoniobacter sp.]|nr:hypothetical protein [Chthoniobacter sp.]
MKKYWQFADEWKIIGRKGYFGPAIISEEALYLIPYREGGAGSKIALGALGGGLLGALVFAATTSKPGNSGLVDAGVTEGLLRELSEEITTHKEWPIKKIKDERMIVIPKKIVTGWRFPWWSGLTLTIEGEHKVFFSPKIQQWTVRKYFSEFGYPKDQRG